ncbi:MAG: M24 family metallopeptidase [Planctomycetota bacterium]
MSAHPQRVDRLRQALQDKGLPNLLVSDEANVTYLTGFTGDSTWLLVTEDRQRLLTDSRYTEQAGHEAPQCELVERKETLVKALGETLAQAEVSRLAFEADALAYATYEEIAEELDGVELLPARDLVEGLRQTKDETEVERVREAIAVAEGAFEEVVAALAAGQSERQVAVTLDHALRRRGARKGSFEACVAARERSSLPHAQPTDAVIQPGDTVLIDWGAEVDLYCSDCTRTLFLSRPDSRWLEIYGVVLAAQRKAIDAIRPGMELKAVDAVAREHIAAAGYGERFGHGLGHGIGLRVHEQPRLSRQAEGTVAAGNVVTVEPGIYIPGWGGVRIEDVIVVREDGAEVLTSLPSDLEAVILEK